MSRMQQPRPTHGKGQGPLAKSRTSSGPKRHSARERTGTTPAPSAPKSAKSRDLILASAARLFRRQGYSATTLRQIAGVAKIEAGSTDGRPKSWYLDVATDDLNAELQFLKSEIYQREVHLHQQEFGALDRYSIRV